MVYIPTFTIKSTIHVGKYTIQYMDPMGYEMLVNNFNHPKFGKSFFLLVAPSLEIRFE